VSVLDPGGTGLKQSPSDCGDGRGDSGLTLGGAGDRRVPGIPISKTIEQYEAEELSAQQWMRGLSSD
jgi:hypothetical protein